ncbi:hypothetical protein [Chryseobacterium indoltheticum]|uniref:hypothetical protein n=1 Tax=Chryseobacterium indoltheticum TaxID=254 RepID=UPI003F493FA7
MCAHIYKIELAMDHREIIEKALLTLRERITYKPIGYNLLPRNLRFQNYRNYTNDFG